MFPIGFLFGAAAGAVAVLTIGPQMLAHARPVAKAALKAALLAVHEARLRGSELSETAEDLFAEAKTEAAKEAFAAAMAQANVAQPAAATGDVKPH